MSIGIGQVVGEYRVVRELGGGGHGRVFQVEHTITRRVEAIKVLADGIPASDDQRRRFLREIQVQAQLCHPNIAAVHNAFWADDNLVMVMEYVEGRSLQSLLAKGVRPEVGLGYLSQVLDALAYAHSQGIVHRDISPANIIVGRAGLVKLTDFGLAKRVLDAPITRPGSLVGSLPYMSPEQVRGLEDPDGRSDIYSCGVVLYEVVTGKKPFVSDCAYTLMRAHVEAVPAPPSSRNPRVPPALSAVILRAMAKDPADRFQTAADFRAALESLDSRSFAAAPVRHWRPSAASLVRLAHSTPVGIALGAFFVTAVLGAVLWTNAEPADPFLTAPLRFPSPPPAPPVAMTSVLESPAGEPRPQAQRSPVRKQPKSKRKSFRPAQKTKPPQQVALLDPPALPREMTELPDPLLPDAAVLQTATAPPPPASGAGRVRRFLGKAKILNPFRQKEPK